MIRDRILNVTFRQLHFSVKEKFGVDLSVDKIAEIVDSQAKMIPIGMAKKEVIKLDYLGKFKIQKGREEMLAKETKKREDSRRTEKDVYTELETEGETNYVPGTRFKRIN